LQGVLKKPLPQARKALKVFPGIGDPAADKILLFTHAYPVMALTRMDCECCPAWASPLSRQAILQLTVWF
jgi:hypothetical protein